MELNKDSIEAIQNAPFWLIALFVILFLVWCRTYYLAHRNKNIE